MVKQLNKALNEVINCIRESNDYKECIRLKSLMDKNTEIKELVEKIKELQKKYIRSGYDDSIKEELDLLEERLYSIPIYDVYRRHLEEVNRRIDYVKDELNDYLDLYIYKEKLAKNIYDLLIDWKGSGLGIDVY